MSTNDREFYTLTHHAHRVSYEFNEKNGQYTVTRMWLNDSEREFMGIFDIRSARNYWYGLVADGFVMA